MAKRDGFKFGSKHTTKLQDVGIIPESKPVVSKVTLDERFIQVGFEGYGEKTSAEGHGSPVVVEIYNGVPRVLIWADINQEDPTHVIELSGAAESKRKPE